MKVSFKRFEYSPLSTELKKLTNVADKQYQEMNKFFKSDKKKNQNN